ncbi:MAG: hypothetical protein ACYSWU_28070, partial [Planctomycetota bacterium]
MSMVETQDALMTAQQLPPELMLLKMENESIMAVARTQPRDPVKIIKQLQELIDAYPAAAEGAIYSKPVGTVQEVTCGNKKCGITYEVAKVDKDTVCPDCESQERGGVRPVKKFAEGLSIRAAESIRTIFGFTRLATTCEILDDGSARLTGVLVDYVAGNVTSDERVVSRQYKTKFSGMVTIAEDRFLNVTVKGEKSKLRRDVILDSTPGIIKAMFRDACERKMLALISPEVIQQKIVPAFAQYGITPAHLDRIIGSPAALGWNKDQKLELRKILTALKNEETTPRELLADLDGHAPTEAPAQPAGGGATMDDLTKPQTPPSEPLDPAVDKAEGKDEPSPEP